MKKILMSMRTTEAQNYTEKRNSIAYEYINFFESLGFIIYLIPNNSTNIKSYFDEKIDLLVLSGGNNVSPNLYNGKNNIDDIYIERDSTEETLVHLSLENNIPIIGICRGFHFLNIYFGGNLSHNIVNHVNKEHFLESNLVIIDKQVTNSFHNHGIKINDLASQFESIAKSKDEIIEAFIFREKKILGMQWHPERQSKIFDKKIIIKFLEGTL